MRQLAEKTWRAKCENTDIWAPYSWVSTYFRCFQLDLRGFNWCIMQHLKSSAAIASCHCTSLALSNWLNRDPRDTAMWHRAERDAAVLFAEIATGSVFSAQLRSQLSVSACAVELKSTRVVQINSSVSITAVFNLYTVLCGSSSFTQAALTESSGRSWTLSVELWCFQEIAWWMFCRFAMLPRFGHGLQFRGHCISSESVV